MKIDKDRLNSLAKPLPEEVNMRMNTRRRDRYWKSASSAIAAKILRRIKEKGITRMKLAELLDITPANITRYLSGETNFELKTLVEIERVLDMHILDRDIVPSEKCPPKALVPERLPMRTSALS